MQFPIHNVLDQVLQLVEQVGASLAGQGVPKKAIIATCLCLEEVLTNTIQYGYGDDGIHDILIDITLMEKELVVEILDDAAPFDPTTEVPLPDVTASLKERQIGGLGVHLVKELTQSMEYARLRHQNRLTFRINISPNKLAH